MEAVVLAGGFGTRLRSVVADVPKPMAPVAGRPFLEILLTMLSSRGFTHVVLSLGYQADVIQRHFGDRFAGIGLSYEIESTPLGTGGALRMALARCASDHVFVFNGDTLLDLEVDELEARWQQVKGSIIVAREVPDTARYGRLDVAGDQVVAFREKGVSGVGLINAGCYVLPRDLLHSYAAGVAFSLEQDYLAPTVQQAPIAMFITHGLFIDIGVPDDYSRAQTLLAPYAWSH